MKIGEQLGTMDYFIYSKLIISRQSLMDSMAAQKDSDFCVKEEPRMAVEDLVQLFVDRDNLAK